ncbi:MAG: 1-acyl-sn-glycerol-3-phosphate acyltransferase, partial [Candidatus Obscuribacterales bacterium]|nr:1-acyl-sn-glycerol-3-phosphate acyltransferase [Candidatus Obscuribacterales bacterium]
MLDFKPPKDSELLIGFLKLMWPVVTRAHMKGATVIVSPEDVEKFKKLKGQRALVCPNHSNRHDPEVMFGFSMAVSEEFNFIAAREVFDYDNGFNGWLLQRVGTYSVVRGAVDRDSFKMTRDILAKGRKKLILFPEGEISRQNDSLMPLESGAAQLSFWALSDILKNDEKESLYIVPIALKYTYENDITSALNSALTEMESKLGVKCTTTSIKERVRSVAEKLLKILETEYRHKAVEGATMNERVDSLRQAILLHAAKQLNVELPTNQRQLEQVRVVRNAIDDFIYDTKNGESQYEQKVRSEMSETIKSCYKDINRVTNFVAIYDGYLSEHMTQERCADIIDRLESEVKGKEAEPRGPR